MKMAPASMALFMLCLFAAGSFSRAEPVAQVRSKHQLKTASQKHSPEFVGFMRKHGKNYCKEHEETCEVSILRWAHSRPFSLEGDGIVVSGRRPPQSLSSRAFEERGKN